MKHNRNPLASAIHYALGASVIAGLAVTAAPVLAQDSEEGEAVRDRIVVTGTRIQRDNLDGAMPVQVIDREAIELSGQTSVADLLRNTTVNSAGSFRPQSGSSAQSFGGVSLRALGSGRTLVLIDGRRMPNAPNVGSGQNLNAIPLAAVERIEILSDGASAIYGTDAIGGVINIITRKDFSGAEVMAGFSNPKRAGGETQEASAILGIGGDRGSAMFGVSWNKRDIIFQRDREWSRGGQSVFSNNFRVAIPAPGSLYGFVPGGFAIFTPEFGTAVPGGCNGEGFFLNAARTQCFYDFTLLAADEAAIENGSLFARGQYEINDDFTLYMNTSVFRLQSFGRYAPVPSSPFPGGAPFIPVGSPNHPAVRFPDAGYDPNTPLFLAHRFAAGGPRDTSIDENQYDLNIGVEGRIGNFDIDVGFRYNDAQYYDLGRNYVVGGLAQQAIADGRYDIYDPFSVPLSIINSFTTTINRDSRFVLREFYGIATTDLMELQAGTVGLAFGAEYREERFADIYDQLSAGGQVVGSAGNSSSGDRDVTAVFAEVLIPILDNLELTLAGRYDDYSDYGSDFSPKVAFRYVPLDGLTFRGSWGEGFRAPPLDILSAEPSFSANGVIDAATNAAFGVAPGTVTQVTNWVIANPDLGSEQSEQWSVGVAFEPVSWLEGSVDFWNIKIDDRVASIGPQTIVNCLLGTTTNCPPGLSNLPANVQPPQPALGLGVARNPDGSILYLQRGFASLGTIETRGIDTILRSTFDLGDFGRLRTTLVGTYTMMYKTDAGDNVAGDVTLPRWRANLSNEYTFGDFQLGWNMSYIGAQSGGLDPAIERSPSFIRHDLQATYFTPWNGRISVGVVNATDRLPPIDFGFSRGFNFDLYDGYGRVPYIRYVQSF